MKTVPSNAIYKDSLYTHTSTHANDMLHTN